MNAINSGISALNTAIDSVVDYLKGNAVAIGCLLTVCFLVKKYGRLYFLHEFVKKNKNATRDYLFLVRIRSLRRLSLLFVLVLLRFFLLLLGNYTIIYTII
jgi:hypothetical protein